MFEVDKFRRRFTQSAKIRVWSSNSRAPAHPTLTVCSFIHPLHLDEGVKRFCFVIYCHLRTFTLHLLRGYAQTELPPRLEKSEKGLVSGRGGVTKSGLMSSEESLFVLAQLHWWGLMLFKSGLRKSQSCCWQSLFSAPGVSIASGHEAHRIYAGDKEGGFHNAWWSASDTLPQSDPCFGGCGKICEATLKIMANKCLYSDQVLRIIVLKSEMKDGGKKYLKVRERLMVYEWRVSRLWGWEIRFSA